MKIITISREFGSGGREIGKKLAILTGFAYYDHEILAAIAKKRGLNENYVDKTLDWHNYANMPLHIGKSFSVNSNSKMKVELMLEEKLIIEQIASLGKDCIIVGRNADVILQKYNPFSLFICAEKESKIKRCMERSSDNENLSSREMLKQIKEIDATRRATRRIITDIEWGNPHAYQLVVNTTDWHINDLVPAIAYFAENYFRRRDGNGD